MPINTSNFVPPRPGDIEIASITIQNYDNSANLDITYLVREFNIYESIFSNTIRADVVIHDAVALTTRLPIVGEETININFRTPSEAPNSFEYDLINLQFYTSKLKDMSIVKERASFYNIELISPIQFKNLTGAIDYALGPDTISNLAKNVANIVGIKYNKEKSVSLNNVGGNLITDTNLVPVLSERTSDSINEIIIEDTETQRQFVIPNLTPFETLNFLASEAKSSAYAEVSNFVFFQNHGGFYFGTIERLIDQHPVETYYFFPQNSPDNEINERNVALATSGKRNSPKFRTMVSFRFLNCFDVESSIVDGLYDNTVYMIDPLLQRFENVQVGSKKYFNYKDRFTDFKHISSNKNTLNQNLNIDGVDVVIDTSSKLITSNGRFANLQGRSHQRYLITNKRQDMSYGVFKRERQDYLPWLISANAALQTIVCEIVIPGDSQRRAGELIFFEMPEFGATDDIKGKINEYLSGSWLIVSCRHKWTADINMPFVTILECCKNTLESTIKKGF